MIKRITLENYMAHKHTTLELGVGVTVLTGPNNTGKSAVVEAIRSVAQNPAPQHVIRHGAARAIVRVELDSGEIIEWVRSKGNTVYNLYRPRPDGGEDRPVKESYAKFGRTPPEDVRQLLRLDPVDTENGSVDIHIGNQRYPIFLLDQSGAQAASFFAASTEAEYLLKMQQALKTRTDRSKSRRKELLQEGAQLDQALERYVPLEAIGVELTAAEARYAEISALQPTLPRLEQAIGVMENIRRQHGVKSCASRVFDDLGAPPAIHETQSLERHLQRLDQTGVQGATARRSWSVLAVLDDPPALQETVTLNALLVELTAAGRSVQQRRRMQAALEDLPAPPGLHEARALEALIASLEQAQQAGAIAARQHEVLTRLVFPPEPLQIAPLERLIAQLADAARQRLGCRRRSALLEQLGTPPAAHPLAPLEALVGEWHEAEARRHKVVFREAVLEQLVVCAEPAATAGIEELRLRLLDLHNALSRNARLQQKIVDAIELKRQEIAQVLQAAGICPLCGQALDMVHFLEETHG